MVSILVVDDDEFVRQTLCTMLDGADHDAIGAPSAKRAGQILGQRAFDIVVADMIMPNEGGLAVISLTRSYSPRTRVIAISGRRWLNGLNLLDFAMSIGADAVLEKPFRRRQLLELVDRLS